MPKLPSVESLGQRPVPRGGAGVVSYRPVHGQEDAGASAAIEEARVGATLRQAGEDIYARQQQLERVAKVEQDRLDTVRAEEALNALQDRREALTSDESSGFKRLKGGNAVKGDLVKDYLGTFDQAQKDIEAGLSNDAQRQKFKLRASDVRRRFGHDAVTHTAQERDGYERQVASSTLQAELNSIAANYDKPVDVAMAVARANETIEREAERTGAGDLKEQVKRDFLDRAWKQRLEAWRLKDPVQALAVFQENAEQISPVLRGNIATELFRAAAPVLATQLNAQGGVGPTPATSQPPRLIETGVKPEEGVKAVPRGIRNNNPGNIVKTDRPWQGEVDGTDPRYASFTTMEDGIRALGKNLIGYQERHGLNTVSQIISRWAPATENDTQAYVKTVSKDLGVQPNEPINVKDRRTLEALTRAIIKVENGPKGQVSDEQIRAGIAKLDAPVSEARGGAPATIAERTAVREPSPFLRVTPEQAANMKTGNPVVDRLPADWRMAVIHTAQTQAKQDAAQMRDGLQVRVQDSKAMYEQGLQAPNPPSESELVYVYGQADGAKIARDLRESQQFGLDVKSVSTMTPAEQAALVTARTPQPGEGFATAQHRQEQLVRAVDQVNKARAQDPAAFVVQNAPAVRQAAAQLAAAPSPATNQAYAEASLAEQRRLGVLEPRILTKQQVDGITAQFYAPQKEGEGVSNILRGISEQWGRHTPQVMKELHKNIPAGAVVIGLGVKPEAEALISEALKLKPEQLQQGIPETDIKDLKDLVRQQFDPLKATLAWQGGGQATYDNYADTAQALAVSLMQKGMKPKEAAQKAFESMVGFKYDFEGSWRVPKAVLGGTVTRQQISDGSNAAKIDVADQGLLAVPAIPGSAARPEDLEKQWRETVRDNGFWVTSPGDGGLSLWVKSGLAAQPVLSADGQPIRRTWDELNASGRQLAPVTSMGPGRYRRRAP